MLWIAGAFDGCSVGVGDVTLFCSASQCVAVSHSVLQCVAMLCSVLHCAAACCSAHTYDVATTRRDNVAHALEGRPPVRRRFCGGCVCALGLRVGLDTSFTNMDSDSVGVFLCLCLGSFFGGGNPTRLVATGWRSLIGCLICVGHYLQKRPIIIGACAGNELRKASYGSSPPCMLRCGALSCVLSDYQEFYPKERNANSSHCYCAPR